jgi:hypothetical protein
MYDIPNLKLVNHKLPGLEYLKGASAAIASRPAH